MCSAASECPGFRFSFNDFVINPNLSFLLFQVSSNHDSEGDLSQKNLNVFLLVLKTGWIYTRNQQHYKCLKNTKPVVQHSEPPRILEKIGL